MYGLRDLIPEVFVDFSHCSIYAVDSSELSLKKSFITSGPDHRQTDRSWG